MSYVTVTANKDRHQLVNSSVHCYVYEALT